MKQLFAIALALVLMIGLSACGRNRKEPVTTPTTQATTTPTTTATVPTTRETEPIMDPTMATNIPDPSVDTSMPDMTDLLPGEEATTDSTTEPSRKN